MSISHWGIFPGWFKVAPMPNGSVPLSGGKSVFVAVDWDVFCYAVDAAAERLAAEAVSAGTRH